MNSLAIVTIFATLAVSNAGLIGPTAEIIQGPSSRTIVAGPDGSAISSVAPGGQIISENFPAVVAGSSPVLAAPLLKTYSTPVLSTYSAPLLSTYSAPLVSAYAAPSVYASGLVAHDSVDTVVAGPSGTIATSKSIAAPAIYAQGIHGLYL